MNYYISMWKNAFDFNGKATRSEYWYAILFNFLIALVLGMISAAAPVLVMVASLYSILIIIPALSLAIRRFRDAGKSPWFILVAFIPLVGWIWYLVILCTPSVTPVNEADLIY